MNFLKNRLKTIEKKVGVNESDDFLIVFISSDDGKSIHIRATLTDGSQKTDTLHTAKDLYNFFGGGSSSAMCMIEDVDGIEPVEGSLYGLIIDEGISNIGNVNINRQGPN